MSSFFFTWENIVIKTYLTNITLPRDLALDLIAKDEQDKQKLIQLSSHLPIIPAKHLIKLVFDACKWLGHEVDDKGLIPCDYDHVDSPGYPEMISFWMYYDGLINSIGHNGLFSIVIMPCSQDTDTFNYKIEFSVLPFAPKQFLDVMRTTFSTNNNEQEF